MPRPGAVVEVDRNTPPTLFHYGEGFRLERLPLGSRILYPADPIEPIAHPERAIRRARAGRGGPENDMAATPVNKNVAVIICL